MLYYPNAEARAETDRLADGAMAKRRTIDPEHVAVVARYQNRWLFVREKKRKSYALLSSRCGEGESPVDAAHRALRETCGATGYYLWPVTLYGVAYGSEVFGGQLFFAAIERLYSGTRPDAVDHCFLSEPEEVLHRTVPQLLLVKANRWRFERRTLLYCFSEGAGSRDAVLKAMEGCHINRAYAYPGRDIGAVLKPLADDRRLRVERNVDLGADGAEMVRRLGIEVLGEILRCEKCGSAALGMHSGMMAEIRKRYKAFMPLDLRAMPIARGPMLPPRPEPPTLRLEFIDDTLIGAVNTWTREYSIS